MAWKLQWSSRVVCWLLFKMMRLGRGGSLLRPLTEIQMQKKLQVGPINIFCLVRFPNWHKSGCYFQEHVGWGTWLNLLPWWSRFTFHCLLYCAFIQLWEIGTPWVGGVSIVIITIVNINIIRSQRYVWAPQAVGKKSWQSEGCLTWNIWFDIGLVLLFFFPIFQCVFDDRLKIVEINLWTSHCLDIPPILILYPPFHPLLVLNLECSLINSGGKTKHSQGDPVCVGEEGSSWTSACPQARQEGNQGLHRLLVTIFPLWWFRILLQQLFYHLSIFVCRCWSSLPTGVPIPWRCTRTQGPGTARQHQEDCLVLKLEICGSSSFQILVVKDKTDQNKCSSMGGY